MLRGALGIKDIPESVKRRFLKFWLGILYWRTTENVSVILGLYKGSASRERREQEKRKKKKEAF